MSFTRRHLLMVGSLGAAVFVGGALHPDAAKAEDDGRDLIEDLTGGTLTESDRVQLVSPPVFPIGSSVPVSVAVDTAMTEADFVRRLTLFAPYNPIVEIMSFNFIPGASVPRVSTRIRLAAPQHVLAVAEMNDGALLMAKQFIDVATNGCSEG